MIPPKPRLSVWLYVPNLIGYVRVLTFLGAVACATDSGLTLPFFVLYSVSYLLDALDGPAARYLQQTSRFGAVLDMVTDRVSTALLLCLLAHASALSGLHAHASAYLALLALDTGAHWVQTYSAGVSGAASHKELQDEPALLTWYYRRHNLFTVCLLSEAHLVMALLLARGAGAVASIPLLSAPLPWGAPWGGEAPTLAAWVWAVSAPVFLLKQLISLVHLVRASQRIVALDTQDRDQQQGSSSNTLKARAAAGRAGSRARASSTSKQ